MPRRVVVAVVVIVVCDGDGTKALVHNSSRPPSAVKKKQPGRGCDRDRERKAARKMRALSRARGTLRRRLFGRARLCADGSSGGMPAGDCARARPRPRARVRALARQRERDTKKRAQPPDDGGWPRRRQQQTTTMKIDSALFAIIRLRRLYRAPAEGVGGSRRRAELLRLVFVLFRVSLRVFFRVAILSGPHARAHTPAFIVLHISGAKPILNGRRCSSMVFGCFAASCATFLRCSSLV